MSAVVAASAGSREPVVEIRAADKVFANGTRALGPVDLTVRDGEFVTLLGPSGCGKSTLLNMIANLIAPSSGQLAWWRKGFDDVGEPGRKLVMVFQDATLGRVACDVMRECGDFVLKRADGVFTYQLAVVVDDAEQGITHVVRGADLLTSTARQIALQQALGYPTPAYTHLPLVLDAQGFKLSKQTLAAPLDDADPLPALRLAGRFLGLPEIGRVGHPRAWLSAAIRLWPAVSMPPLRGRTLLPSRASG